jgi:hypothetical protein
MFPKNISVTPQNPDGLSCRAVLGGTFIADMATQSNIPEKNLDTIEFKRLLDRNSLFFSGKLFDQN